MARNVKGVLFADYVRMIRHHKGVDWDRCLSPEDLQYVQTRVEPDQWYPMTTFERLGDAILVRSRGETWRRCACGVVSRLTISARRPPS